MQLSKTKQQTNLIDRTKSVCPVCLKVIAAQIITRDQAVYMEKKCPKHGAFQSYLWPDVDHYRWMSSFQFPYIKPQTVRPSTGRCLEDCGLCETHRRRPTLVEFETTHRCNLRCPVCFMAAGQESCVEDKEYSLPVFKEMYEMVRDKVGFDVSIQLTGGEPTVRPDLSEIVALGRSIGFSAIEINTNGIVIAEDEAYLASLAAAGISGVYLQFDGMNGSLYETIRGRDLLAKKMQAIANCRRQGVQVVLAMTVIAGINDDQVGAVLKFALENNDVIAGVAYQPAFGSGRFDVAPVRRLTIGDVALMLESQSGGVVKANDFWPLGCSHPLCDAATYLVEQDGAIVSLTSMITPETYQKAFDPSSPQGSVFPDIAQALFPRMQRGLSVVMMNFMDADILDLKKIQECSMTVMGPDGHIIPFCVYQLTNQAGKRKNEL